MVYRKNMKTNKDPGNLCPGWLWHIAFIRDCNPSPWSRMTISLTILTCVTHTPAPVSSITRLSGPLLTHTENNDLTNLCPNFKSQSKYKIWNYNHQCRYGLSLCKEKAKGFFFWQYSLDILSSILAHYTHMTPRLWIEQNIEKDKTQITANLLAHYWITLLAEISEIFVVILWERSFKILVLW